MRTHLPRFSDQYSVSVSFPARSKREISATKSIGAFIDEEGLVHEEEVAAFVGPLLRAAENEGKKKD